MCVVSDRKIKAIRNVRCNVAISLKGHQIVSAVNVDGINVEMDALDFRFLYAETSVNFNKFLFTSKSITRGCKFILVISSRAKQMTC